MKFDVRVWYYIYAKFLRNFIKSEHQLKLTETINNKTKNYNLLKKIVRLSDYSLTSKFKSLPSKMPSIFRRNNSFLKEEIVAIFT